ncbi:hypothetical protein UA08_04685 [Talaromyces atroroseus]|uniref:Uncharacterized protein n=1 Tax=Talaromyces atroroseus TaxID=1441469 RepID=A0A225ANB9_TALAT|nr:hypothetical protein UA08_04685 [Talaromyces atroroseus]OKL59864.1 hypothetical protein UA08_04685 [Talaromyces atroroseus]
MAYNPVAQAEDSPVEPLASADAAAHESLASAQRGLGSLINSLQSSKTDYDVVEDDDYDDIAAIVRDNKTNAPATFHRAEIARSTSPEPLVRTSSNVSIPLRHPTPDLQSLQGAYVGNIERLEKSAERLSMTSSDIGAELRKLDLEQKRRSSASSSAHHVPESPSRQMSTSSMSNSIIAVNSAARSGGYSPAGFLSSPRGSILSGSRFRSTSVTSPLQDIHEPKQEDDDMEAVPIDDRDVPILTPTPLPLHGRKEEINPLDTHPADDVGHGVPDRPLTAHSTDTYQQATDLFLDFDGVHFVPHPKQTPLSRQLSLDKPPRATTAEHYKEPQAGQDLIYYPAPIPKLLNLPQRLSKQPASTNAEKRRTRFMDSIPDKKDIKLVGDAAEQRANKRLSTLPPQLRASVFFDQPTSNISSLGVQMKDRSAVSTLDSILDASTHAPVSAFTDHPIVGSAGANVYAPAEGLAKKRASRMSLKNNGKDAYKTAPGPRESALFVPDESAHGHSAYSDNEATQRNADDADWDDHHSHSHSSSDVSSVDSHGSEGDVADDDEDDDDEEKEDYETEEPMLFGRPTTLLAELQMRKQEQKQRTRTAANAFPNGMHSTLLELDAVAQAQSNKRRQKHVTLAWEAEAVQNPDEGDEDEDIPLGLLYGHKDPAAEERPLGLMERREMEESEPLSKRRARLRGEAVPSNKRSSTMTQLQSLAAAEPDSGDEGETLGQRLRRLKQEKRDKSKSIVSAEFENEIMAELGKLHEAAEPVVETPGPQKPLEKAPVNEEEETLGQRRKRLQAEAQAQMSHGTRNVRASKSMADILQAYPSHNPGFPASGYSHDRQMSLNPGSIHTHRLSTGHSVRPSMSVHAGLAQAPGYPTMQYNPSYIPGGVNVYTPHPHNAAMMQQNIDPRQRDVIDRWRQSVV